MIKNLIITGLVTLNAVLAWSLLQAPVPVPAVGHPDNSKKTIYRVETPAEPDDAAGAEANSLTDRLIAPLPEFDGNYSALAEQLRASGYQEDLVRQILLATMNRDHLATLQAAILEPYWQHKQQTAEDRVREALGWDSQKRLMLIDVFGEDIIADPLFEDLFKPLNESLPFLNSDKQIAIFELKQFTSARSEALFRNGYTQEAREERRDLQQQMTDQLTELLTPDEMFEYQLRESRLAARMLRTAASFDYTEQEFRDVFAIRQQNEGADFNAFTDRRSYLAKRDISNDQVKDYLGAVRFDAYARSQDPAFRSLQAIGERYGNSNTEIIEVYEVTKLAREEITGLRNQESLSREERRDLMQQIRTTSFSEIESIAGKDTADSVRNNSRQIGFGGRRF